MVTNEVMDAGSKLQLIGRVGSSVENINVNYASRKGIVVMNTPGGMVTSSMGDFFFLRF